MTTTTNDCNFVHILWWFSLLYNAIKNTETSTLIQTYYNYGYNYNNTIIILAFKK